MADSPLKKYLAKEGITQGEFADILTRHRGAVVYQHQVSNWATGKVRPTKSILAMIAKATENAVPVTAWLDFWHRPANSDDDSAGAA